MTYTTAEVTAGEWHYSCADSSCEVDECGHDEGPFQIYTHGDTGGIHATAETLADARLLRAAPDLLQALKAIEQVLDGRQPIDVPGAVLIARHWIAAAEGR